MEVNVNMARKEAKGDFKILMEGSKTFWRQRCNLDILIVSHPGQKCIEVAAYNAVIGVEAPRIYISSVLLDAKINSNSTEFEEKLKEAQEEVFLLKRTTCNAADLKKQVYNECNAADLRKQVYNEMVVGYIMRRLIVVTKGIDLTKELRVELSTISSMVDEKNQYVICKMPCNLHPVKFAFARIDR
jgi:hypothetical protein